MDGHFDIVIVGGGMVGASLACALQRRHEEMPARILVVEPAPLDAASPAQPGYDARSTALSHGSVEYLRRLGLWENLAPRACPINSIHVSDRGRFSAVRMDCLEYAVDALGYVAENVSLGSVLNTALGTAEAVTLWDSARVESITPGSRHVGVRISRHGEVRDVSAALVVLAEGGRSGLCEQLGIIRRTRQYGQTAIIANVSFTHDHAHTAFERFTGEGPVALLPLHDLEGEHRAALVWTRRREEVEATMALADEAFLAALQHAFGHRVGRFTRVGERFSYPLHLVRATEQCRWGLVLLGNVAQSLHPVAGQGFNLALRNAMMLAETLLEALARGDSPGDVRYLQAYVNKTAGDQARTVTFSDGLTRVFSSHNRALVRARQLGLLSVDLLPPVRRALVHTAMGLGDRMARL